MKTIRVGDRAFPVGVVVFDKDGLLFESRQFWIELANARAKALASRLPETLVQEWLTLFGAQTLEGCVADMDPRGILAVASPAEEITVTAGFFVQKLGLCWTEARDMARQVFADSDKAFRLQEALRPRKGFPGILKRLRDAGVPYGIATSDTYERARDSIDLFDNSSALSFVVTPAEVTHGKPDPEMLYLISEKTGVAPGRIMMVGDSYVDVAMAKACGAIGVGVPEQKDMAKRMTPYASAIVEDLDAIVIED